jgi:hypothetical protein
MIGYSGTVSEGEPTWSIQFMAGHTFKLLDLAALYPLT